MTTRMNNEVGTAPLGFQARLWQAADALRSNMDAAEYKHVVLGLIFLKYISDAFEAKRAGLEAERDQGADPEDPDEYRAENIFWVPKEARWSHLKDSARQPRIGEIVDEAMVAIERDNPSLKGVLPKEYARPGLDKQRLGQLIDLITNIGFGGRENQARDILGRVYEYFLSQFASAEGRKGGQFYTPRHVVRILVEMLAPYEGRVFDPCCGSGGMFVQSARFIEAHTSGNGNGGRARTTALHPSGGSGTYPGLTRWQGSPAPGGFRFVEGVCACGPARGSPSNSGRRRVLPSCSVRASEERLDRPTARGRPRPCYPADRVQGAGFRRNHRHLCRRRPQEAGYLHPVGRVPRRGTENASEEPGSRAASQAAGW